MNFLNKLFLQGEVKKWLAEGIITQNLADTLSKRYDLNINEEGSNFILKIIGYFFIALALIVLIGANWEEIPRNFRMLLLLSLTLITHISGYLHYKNDKENTAIGLFFLGNMIFGASIILIAQIYHLGEHMPDGVFAWSMGSLIFALILRNKVLMIQALILGFIWAAIEFHGYDVTKPFFALFLLASAFVLIKDYSPVLMFLTLMAFFDFSFQIFYMIYTSASESNLHYIEYTLYSTYFIYVFTFLLLAVYGVFSNFYNRYSPVVLGSVFFMGIIYLLNSSIFEYSLYEVPMLSRTTMTIFYIILALLAMFAIYKRAFGFVAFCVLYAALPLISNEDFLSNTLNIEATNDISKYISSVTVFLVAVWLIYQSSKTDSSAQLYAGICTIFSLALIRYIELLGDYIGASIMFFIFAVVMLLVARSRSKKRIA